MNLELLQEDIDLGCAGQGSRCPWARALWRLVRKEDRAHPSNTLSVFEGYTEIRIHLPAGWRTIKFTNPLEMKTWVHNFDRGCSDPIRKTLKPMTVEIPELDWGRAGGPDQETDPVVG